MRNIFYGDGDLPDFAVMFDLCVKGVAGQFGSSRETLGKLLREVISLVRSDLLQGVQQKPKLASTV